MILDFLMVSNVSSLIGMALCNNSDNPEGNMPNNQTKMPYIWIFWALDAGQSKLSGAKGFFLLVFVKKCSHV